MEQQKGSFKANDIAGIPTFMIIGAAKCGTTDLYYQLINSTVNTDPTRPDPPLLSDLKEVKILHKAMAGDALLPGSPLLRRYLDHIRHPCAASADKPGALRTCLMAAAASQQQWQRPQQQQQQLQQLTIDASPMSLSSPFTALQLRAISPETKVLLLLREPMEALESLYYHRQKEGRWEGTTLNDLTDQFFDFIEGEPARAAAFARLLQCNRENSSSSSSGSSGGGSSGGGGGGGAARCQEEGWRELTALGLMGSLELRLFANSLYVYALAPWRRHYFSPGRVMVLDSHTYYHNRLSVMQQVIWFLYGREMTSVERELAATAPPKNPHHRTAPASAAGSAAASAAGPSWQLSTSRRARLGVFFDQHVTLQLYDTLEEMRREGVWVVGFERPPWPWAARAAAARAPLHQEREQEQLA